MQIASNYKASKKSRWKNWPVMLAVIALFLFTALAFLSQREQSNEYFCDMEKSDGKVFKAGWATFSNGRAQSNEEALNGKFSAKCDSKVKYGPTLILKNVSSGDIIVASVWQQSDKGYGSLIFQGEWKGYFEETRKARKVLRGWEQLYMIDTIPVGVQNAQLKVYSMISSKDGSVYFDDFKIKHIKRKEPQMIWNKEAYKGQKLNLLVDESDISKLKIKRTEALDRGNLITGRKDLVKAKLKESDQEVDVQVRLKGDLLDHLQGNKWSFRIIPEKGQSWNGMREFSVHNTASRAHLLEWVFHEMLKDEDILTTRYDFIQLDLNKELLGIYAYEEHFAYPMLNQQGRERGPILRISEDGLWQYAAAGFSNKIPWYESAQIEAFEEKEILDDEGLYQQFLEGQQKMYDYVQGNKTVGELFDIDRMAKFIAIQDVCLAYHAFGSTNQRYYYNAVLGKLEPIGYDGYSTDGVRWFEPPLIYGGKVNSRVSKRFKFRNGEVPFHYFLFNDFEFVEKYVGYLEEFTSEKYLQDFMAKHMSDIKSRELFIQQEYKNYYFDSKKVFKNTSAIQAILYPAENVTIKAYKNAEGEIILENYHQLPIEIVGFGNKNIQYRTPQRLITEAFHPETPVRRYTVPVKGKVKAVFCKTLGTNKVVRLPIFNWPAPVSKMAFQKADINDLKKHSNIAIQNKVIYLQGGTQKINQDLLIPAGYEFQIPAGTNIQLNNNTSIVSYSPVFIKGTKEQPVLINASQGGQGFVVINADEKSVIEHTVFSDLSARNKNGQITEGGVTFYNSDFTCQGCYFKNSKAKDALSIINSEYRLDNSAIINASGDGMDANQSKGTVDQFLIEKTGKDAIEITGGYLQVHQAEVNQSFGAALNVNRSGFAEITNSYTINETQKGITASDLSKVTANNVVLNKVNQGFVVFQKLAEYGSGNMDIKNFEAKEVKQLHVVDLGAILTLKGNKIEAY